MKISELPNAPKWLLDASTDRADVEWNAESHDYVVWRGGVWRGGDWRGGVWHGGDWCGGVWHDGVWLGGVWRGESIQNNLLNVLGLRWPITISDTRMQVGCELHTFPEWESFDDERINKMDRGALKFWRQHKAALMALCGSRAG